MNTATGQYSSALRVSVKPLQSSFFAGEEFVCSITFTNTNPKVTHTQPIPQTATFPDGDHPLHHDDQGSVSTSTVRSDLHTSTFSNRRVVSGAPFSKAHGKSKSVDVRALLSPGKAVDPPGSNAEQFARNSTRLHRSKALLRQMDGEELPGRKGLIGVAKSIPPSPATSFASWGFQPTNGNGPKGSSQHSKAASVSGPWNHSVDRGGLGLGLPPSSSHLGAAQAAPEGLARLQISPSPSANASPASHNSRAMSPTRSRAPSFGTGRKSSTTISSKHPHSRKKSVAQTQTEDLTEAFELDATDRALAPSTMSVPSTPNGSAPAQTPWGNESFYRLGQNDTMESVFRDSINDWSQDVKRQGLPGPGGKSPLYPNNDLLPSGTEKVLWSFAQLGGLVEIDESLIKPGDFENLKQRLAYGDVAGSSISPGSMPGTPRAIGGGDLGHEEAHGVGASTGWSDYLRQTLRASGSKGQARHRRTGSTLQDTRDRTLQSRSVPTFSTPPSILAVDLTLGPEESRSYTFRIQLPVDLPPSYHGKAIRFQYNLNIGTNKLDTGMGSHHSQRSRLIQVPIRVYNHVAASGVRPFYDLMNPVIFLREQAKVVVELSESEVAHGVGSGARTARKDATPRPDRHRAKITRAELESYVRDQLRPRSHSDVEAIDPFASEGLAQESCKAAVELLSRTSTKVSYDISKDGKVAAVLTLVKSKYRLGDTVMGVISINEGGSLARIARIAATLETFEEVQPSIALLPAGRMQRTTRVVHAEHHESTLDKGRAGFALPIPSGAAPEFVTSGVKLNWTVRLSFLTIASTRPDTDAARPPPPAHLVPSSSDGFALYHTSLRALPSLAGPLPHFQATTTAHRSVATETKLETVECAVPVTVLPNSTGFKVGTAEFFA